MVSDPIALGDSSNLNANRGTQAIASKAQVPRPTSQKHNFRKASRLRVWICLCPSNQSDFIVRQGIVDDADFRGFDQDTTGQKSPTHHFLLGQPTLIPSQALPVVKIANYHPSYIAFNKHRVSYSNAWSIINILHSTSLSLVDQRSHGHPIPQRVLLRTHDCIARHYPELGNSDAEAHDVPAISRPGNQQPSSSLD